MAPHLPALALAVSLGALAACAEAQPPDGGDAVVACHTTLDGRFVNRDHQWRTTSEEQGEGWVVNVWTDGKDAEDGSPAGLPNYVCDVARDDAGDRGVTVRRVRP